MCGGPGGMESPAHKTMGGGSLGWGGGVGGGVPVLRARNNLKNGAVK